MYRLIPYSRDIIPWVTWVNEFTEDELNWLQRKAEGAERNGAVGNSQQDSTVRRSRVGWLDLVTENNWVFEKLSHVVSSINSVNYQFDLTGFGEPLQLTNYKSEETGMYGWHQDFGGKISRKLSVVLQLSDPSEYEGGNLQIYNGVVPSTVSKQRGLLAIFPSYTLHQVTPVTQGSRQSLVAWVSGPNFK